MYCNEPYTRFRAHDAPRQPCQSRNQLGVDDSILLLRHNVSQSIPSDLIARHNAFFAFTPTLHPFSRLRDFGDWLKELLKLAKNSNKPNAQYVPALYKHGAAKNRIQAYIQYLSRWCQSSIKKHHAYIETPRQYLLSLKSTLAAISLGPNFRVEATHYRTSPC